MYTHDLKEIEYMYPDTCPICKKIGTMVPFKDCNSVNQDGTLWQVVFKCPSKMCGRLFIAFFNNYYHNSWQYNGSYLIESFDDIEFSSEIRGISESFCQIFLEANIAENNNLKEIAGMGYRKALEFLMKDFLISETPEETEKIKKLMIGKPEFLNYIKDGDLKDAFEMAVWLGNDETHYIKRRNKEVADLKSLIDICVSYIEKKIKFTKYRSEMKKKK